MQGSVSLDHDVSGPVAVDLRAWLELPDGGTTQHNSSATLVGGSPLGSAWRGTATEVMKLSSDGLVEIRATAQLTSPSFPGRTRAPAMSASSRRRGP